MIENVIKKQKIKETVWYSLLGSIWLLGFILAILGLFAFNSGGKLLENPLYNAQKSFAAFLGIKGLIDFRLLGVAIMVIAMCALLIALYGFAKKSDQLKSKAKRKAERIKSLEEDSVVASKE